MTQQSEYTKKILGNPENNYVGWRFESVKSHLGIPGKREDLPAVIIGKPVDGKLVLSLLDVVGLDQGAEYRKA